MFERQRDRGKGRHRLKERVRQTDRQKGRQEGRELEIDRYSVIKRQGHIVLERQR